MSNGTNIGSLTPSANGGDSNHSMKTATPLMITISFKGKTCFFKVDQLLLPLSWG